MGQVVSDANNILETEKPKFIENWIENQKINDQVWGDITVYTDPQTSSQMAVKEIVFYDIESFNISMNYFSQKKMINHPNIISLQYIEMTRSTNLCATTFRLFYAFNFHNYSLQNDITKRSTTLENFKQNNYTETEIWILIENLVSAVLQMNRIQVKLKDIRLQTIFVTKEGRYKILDTDLSRQITPYDMLVNKLIFNYRGLYLAPEQLQDIRNNIPFQNYEQSDIFQIGMIILACCYLENLDQAYNYQYLQIDEKFIKNKIEQVGQKYSKKLQNTLNQMLNFNLECRPGMQLFAESILLNNTQSKYDLNQFRGVNKQVAEQRLDTNTRECVYVTENDLKNYTYTNENDLSIISQDISQQNGWMQSNQKEFTQKQFQDQVSQFGFQEQPSQFNCQNTFFKGSNILPVTQQGQKQENFYLNQEQIKQNQYGNQKLQNLLLTTNEQQMPQFNENQKNFDINQQHLQQFSTFSQLQNQQQQTENSYLGPDLYSNFPENSFVNIQNISDSKNYSLQGKNVLKELGDNKNVLNYKKSDAIQQLTKVQDEIKELKQKYLNSNKKQSQKNKENQENENTQQTHLLQDTLKKKAPEIQKKIFQTVVYDDGSIYEGQIENEMRNGKGRLTYCDNAYYEGEWFQNYIQGYGKLYYPSQNLAYQGSWKQDMFEGKGIVFRDGITYDEFAQIDHKDLSQIDENSWNQFEGYFAQDLKEGQGTYIFINGDKFTCWFKGNSPNGQGIYFSKKNNQNYKGMWQNGKMVQIYQ